MNNGQTGIVIDGNKMDEIVHAIAYLIENKPVRKAMGLAGKAWALQNDWKNIAGRTSETITRIACS